MLKMYHDSIKNTVQQTFFIDLNEIFQFNVWLIIFNAIYWSSLLFGIFMFKKWVEFSLTYFSLLEFDCVIKTIKMFNFLPLINS